MLLPIPLFCLVSQGARCTADGADWRAASAETKAKYQEIANALKLQGDQDLDEKQRQRRIRGHFDAAKEQVSFILV